MISAPLQKAFMLLLRQGLWDRQEDCSALFPLDEKEWNEIHSMARKQTVQGIIYDGIRLLPTEAVPPRKVLLGWMVEVDTLERVNRQHRETIKALQQIYVQSPSIPFLLLKGIGTADFYPHPHSRRHRPVVRKQDTNRTSQPTDGKIRITGKKRNQW